VKHSNSPGLSGLSWPGVAPGDQVCHIDAQVAIYRNNPLYLQPEDLRNFT